MSPETAVASAAITDLVEEVGRVLSHPVFSHSERCSKLLRYLLESAKTSPDFPLKERTIGHDVFGRAAGYDTYADPIVRNVASEVRKRLKQFYEASPRPDGCSVELPSGHYILLFRNSFSDGGEPPTPESIFSTLIEDPVGLSPVASAPAVRPVNRRGLIFGLAAAVAAPVLGLGGIALGKHMAQAQASPFWDPVLRAGKEVLVCLGSQRRATDPSGAPMSYSPAVTAAYGKVSGMLAEHGKLQTMRSDSATSISDIRDVPTVLIGRVSNPWTDRLGAGLRYKLHRDIETDVSWIEDTTQPTQTWSVLHQEPHPTTYVDYAMIARILSPVTGSLLVFLSGVGRSGTCAAAEFLTANRYRGTFSDNLRDERRSVQIVLKTQVVNDVTGPPEILTIQNW